MIELTDSFPPLSFNLPQETIGGAVNNTWTVSDGEIISVSYLSTDFDPGVEDDTFQFFNNILSDTGFTGILNDNAVSSNIIGNASFNLIDEPSSVPEPSLILGLFGLGVLGTSTTFKQKFANNSNKK